MARTTRRQSSEWRDKGGMTRTVPATGSEGTVRQRTLKNGITCSGTGLHSGAKVRMALRPAEADSGVVFRRTDPAGRGAEILARWDNVIDTRMNTMIGDGSGAVVGTIEHLMSALAGANIDNCVIELDGPEVPVMDGSAAPFVFLIDCAGVRELDAPRRAIEILRTVSVGDHEKSAVLTPGKGFSVSFEIDFDNAVVGRQEFFVDLANGAYARDIARARTFGFEQEVEALRAAGLGRGGSLDNAVVVSGEGILNEDGLRYENEFVRHKVLDSIGDLYLAGGPILGHFHGYRSGHALNNELLRAVFADDAAWRWATFDDARPAPAAMPEERRLAVGA